MSSTPETPASAAPLKPEDLTGPFHRGERPDRRQHKIGTEQEKFGVVVADGSYRPVEYEAHVLAVMQGFIDRFGWQPGGERGDGGALISLERAGASITLEPGGQFELSGAPLADVHQTCQEFTQHQRELDAVSRELGIAWLAAGFHPFATREALSRAGASGIPEPNSNEPNLYPRRGQRRRGRVGRHLACAGSARPE